MRHGHVCLLPPEILLNIFTTIREDNPGEAFRTVASLASTCRTFKDPALNVLWENISGIKPLLSCLPEGVVQKGEGIYNKLELSRPFFPGEWKIFEGYARRIHSLTIVSSKLDEISDQVVDALVSTPSSTLLPNLRRLQWLDARESFFPLLRILLVPTITSIRLGFDVRTSWRRAISKLPSFWKPSFAKSALLASLGARCPSIRELGCVYGYRSDGEGLDAVSEAVCGCRELVHLNAGVLNAQAIAHLASLPSLKSLHIWLSCDEDSNTLPNSILTFASKLDELSIAAVSYAHLTQCFKNVRLPSCRSVLLPFDLDWNGPDEPYDPLDIQNAPYDPLGIPDFIVSFSECFSPVLEQLRIETELYTISPYKRILNDRRFAFGFDVIIPLLQFSRLTKLDLNWICTSNVDDNAFKKMVQSWPLLEEFYFGCGNPWLVPPSLTFIGLVHLIQHCQHLHCVQISFSAGLINADSEPFSTTIPNKMITRLFVGVSPISDPVAVACQLHALLPKLTHVDCYNEPEYQPLMARNKKWVKVVNFLEVLIKGAELREKIGKSWEE